MIQRALTIQALVVSSALSSVLTLVGQLYDRRLTALTDLQVVRGTYISTATSIRLSSSIVLVL
jgi:hypothetical protein